MTNKQSIWHRLIIVLVVVAVAGLGIAAFKLDLAGSTRKSAEADAPKRPKVGLVSQTYQISSASVSSGVVTITTTGPNRLSANDKVVIAGVGAGYDGDWTIAAVNSDNSTFTYTDASATGAVLNRGTVKDKAHTVSIPAEVLLSLGIRKNGKDVVAIAEKPKGKRSLELSGSTAFDPGSTYRLHARFAPAEVVSISKISYVTGDGTQERELRTGDFVKANAPLGVFYSVDVGSKKNDLIDALVQYKLDNQLLEKAGLSGAAIPEVLRLTYERNVHSDVNAINRALSILEAWRIPQEDVAAVYSEADEIFKSRATGQARPRKYDPDKDDKWGKVILRSPADGYIVERNISDKEIVTDQTLALFQIAKADKLLVMANAPEETVKELYDESKKGDLKWTIRTLGEPNSDGVSGPIESIGMIVDPNQHTVPIKGYIDNKEKVLRAGQLVTATIQLRAPEDAVEVPAAAIADDGRQAIVFVQPDANKSEFVMRRVMITGRNENRVCVRSQLSEKEKQLTPEEQDQGLLPKSELKVGERVITSGLLELKKELEDLESENQ